MAPLTQGIWIMCDMYEKSLLKVRVVQLQGRHIKINMIIGWTEIQ